MKNELHCSILQYRLGEHDEHENTGVDQEQTDELVPESKRFEDFSRREVRSMIFHILYAVDAFEYQESVAAIIDNFNRGFDLDIPLSGEFIRSVEAIVDQREELDELYRPLLANWRFDRISIATMLILRYATWEIRSAHIDPRIIINEAVEIAKCFAEEDAFRFINGILDRVAKQFSPVMSLEEEKASD